MTTTSLIHRERTLPRPAMLLLGLAFSLCSPFAVAQSNLGELLDAGAKMLSPEQFKQELLQRTIVGLTASGGNIEIMYANNGVIQGVGANPYATGNVGNPFAQLSGEWKIDDSGKICTSMRIGSLGGVILPFRCQFWFKYQDQYFLSDSDTDRSAKVLRRTVKQ